jgi:co-chaperonin GroES (HSP10)
VANPIAEFRERREAQWALANSRIPKKLNNAVKDLYVVGDRVLVVREDPPSRIGSLHIPETAQRPLSKGWIVSAGEKVGRLYGLQCSHPNRSLPVDGDEDAVGLKVLFGTWTGQAVRVSDTEDPYDTEYLLLDQTDIWGVLTEDHPPQAAAKAIVGEGREVAAAQGTVVKIASAK